MPPTAVISNAAVDYVALGRQSAAGTPQDTTSAYLFARWLDGTEGVTHERVQTTEREGGDGQDMGYAYIEHHTGKGNLVAYARPEITAKALGWALGAGSMTSAASTWPYTHELYPANEAAILTYEAFAPQGVIGERLVDSKISEVAIEAEHGKPVKITVAVNGGDSPQQRVAGSARTVSYETDEPFYFNTASHQLAIAGAALGMDEVTKWTCTFTREQDEEVFGVGYGRKAITDLNRNVTLDLTRRFLSATLHNAVAYGGGSAIAPTVATGSFKVFMTNGLTGSALRSFELEVPLMVMQPLSRNVFEVDGQTVYEDISAVAIKPRSGGTHLVRAQVKNLVPTSIASGMQ